VKFQTFGKSNIRFNVLLRAEKVADQYLIKHEFIKQLIKRFNEENIDISYPTREIYQK
jgi:small-conductance mechanosensitive channel